jgi:alkanesulfonate monooxygenase SsuD/methylene tetrahydromethanopterin reductase-like flavin-dependent oxidoreductase (luciferase family)
MKIGYALPTFVDDPELPLAVAQRAEAAGLDGVFVYDHMWRDVPPPRRGALECFALLGAVAAETERVQLGPLVARATLRPPASLTAALDTVHRVSRGRLIAGLGAGDQQIRAENEAFGLGHGSMAERVAALVAAVLAARGRGYPVWVGGNLSRVGEAIAIADGWNTWGGTVESFAVNASKVHEVAPGVTRTWGGLVLLGRDDDHAAGKAASRRVGPEVVYGGPVRVAKRLQALERGGAEWVVLAPVDATDPENVDLLAELVVPRLARPQTRRPDARRGRA